MSNTVDALVPDSYSFLRYAITRQSDDQQKVKVRRPIRLLKLVYLADRLPLLSLK